MAGVPGNGSSGFGCLAIAATRHCTKLYQVCPLAIVVGVHVGRSTVAGSFVVGVGDDTSSLGQIRHGRIDSFVVGVGDGAPSAEPRSSWRQRVSLAVQQNAADNDHDCKKNCCDDANEHNGASFASVCTVGSCFGRYR